jgi:ribosomal-protein-alanine N-acetyltransferase
MAAAEVVEHAAPREEKRRQPSGTLWLGTPNWLLMTVTPAYAELFARLHRRNGHHFRMGMTLQPEMEQAPFWTGVLENQHACNKEGNGLFLVGFHKGSPAAEIGCVISFSGIVHDDFQACWLGFRVDRALEGRGLMHEVLEASVRAVFERYRLHRIMASHLPENLRSARVLRRLGFGIEGYSRDFMLLNGEWKDNVLLSRIATDPVPR